MSTASGRLFVIGLGPGESAIMTGQAQAALSQADVVIGYTGYFTWIEDLVRSKECLALPLRQETERAQLAVDRALQGETVCVISSGDAGIYGMASLVLDVVAQRQTEAPLADVVVVPGVSAVNACAALLGAPIGHDFAVISLSDLLTPWAAIEQRLTAAAVADFVTVLLNPKSARRDWQYARAQAIVAGHRAPDTPVGVVRNAYRPDQSVVVTTVEAMAAASVDMVTTVFVGNTQTRGWRSHMLTPRGYTVAATR
ncbi:Cobalt-factor III methyltransferase [Candidatus Entotheonellaceae bacterium PAL068K]